MKKNLLVIGTVLLGALAAQAITINYQNFSGLTLRVAPGGAVSLSGTVTKQGKPWNLISQPIENNSFLSYGLFTGSYQIGTVTGNTAPLTDVTTDSFLLSGEHGILLAINDAIHDGTVKVNEIRYDKDLSGTGGGSMYATVQPAWTGAVYDWTAANYRADLAALVGGTGDIKVIWTFQSASSPPANLATLKSGGFVFPGYQVQFTSAPDAGASIALFGLAMGGLAFMARRKQ